MAKDEGYLPGLSFLDTSRGINPIVEKLPGGLQEAWVKEGSRYKKDHKAHYPPFSYFVQFVNNHAEMRTDPSFILQNCGPAHMKSERTLVRQTRFKVPITTNKTQVGAANNEPKAPPLDPNKQCPVHKKPHFLAKCRGFRMKTLDERRGLLKELSICYKCLSSTDTGLKTVKLLFAAWSATVIHTLPPCTLGHPHGQIQDLTPDTHLTPYHWPMVGGQIPQAPQ